MIWDSRIAAYEIVERPSPRVTYSYIIITKRLGSRVTWHSQLQVSSFMIMVALAIAMHYHWKCGTETESMNVSESHCGVVLLPLTVI